MITSGGNRCRLTEISFMIYVRDFPRLQHVSEITVDEDFKDFVRA